MSTKELPIEMNISNGSFSKRTPVWLVFEWDPKRTPTNLGDPFNKHMEHVLLVWCFGLVVSIWI